MMPMSTRNKNFSMKLSTTNQSTKKHSVGDTNTAMGHSQLNDTSKLSTSSNKTNVSSLISPSRKFLHKKNQSDVFDFKEKPSIKTRGPKIGQGGSDQQSLVGLYSGRTSPKIKK